jgi:hypothetical protein
MWSKSMTFPTPHIGHSRHGLFFTRLDCQQSAYPTTTPFRLFFLQLMLPFPSPLQRGWCEVRSLVENCTRKTHIYIKKCNVHLCLIKDGYCTVGYCFLKSSSFRWQHNMSLNLLKEAEKKFIFVLGTILHMVLFLIANCSLIPKM